jgi:hypothetical protein
LGAGALGFVAAGPLRGSLAPSSAPLLWWAVAAAVCLVAGRQSSVAAPAVLLLGVLLLAFQLRWDHLVADPRHSIPLSLDAQSYFDEALELDRLAAARQTNLVALFFGGSTWFREPLYVFALRGWLAALGRTELHAVWFSIAASLAWIAASAVAIGALLGRWPGVLTALLLAVDDVWIRNAVIGLREEGAGALLVATVAALYAGRARGWGFVLRPLSFVLLRVRGRPPSRPGW